MERKPFAVKANFVYSADRETLASVPHGFLVCEEGRSSGVFPVLPERYAGLPVEDFGDRLVIPGLVDLHLHAPQFAFAGMGTDMELLPWLEHYAFCEETKYSDASYAEEQYGRFARALSAGATTRACVFSTLHRETTVLLMELLERTGIRAFVGKVNMDRNSPDSLRETAEESARETERWIRETRDRFENVRPILTPRFIPSCTDELMEELGRLRRKYRLPVQSHLSENRNEIRWVKELHPECGCYGAAYDRYGLFGGDGCPAVMAHCVHSTEEEIELIRARGVFIAHCPQSNVNLCSGVAPVRAYLERGLRVGLGTDVAGGASISMFRAITDAIHASKMRYMLVDPAQKYLTVPEAFFLATKGGGAFFGKVGSFEPGFDLDAVVLDDVSLGRTAELTPVQRLERLLYRGDDRNVAAKYVTGKRVR